MLGRCAVRARAAAVRASERAQFPIVIAEWPRNSRELIRVSLDRYQDRETIDIRSFWKDEGGNWCPSRSGLTLSVSHLPKLSEALADALERAQAMGLVTASSGTPTVAPARAMKPATPGGSVPNGSVLRKTETRDTGAAQPRK